MGKIEDLFSAFEKGQVKQPVRPKIETTAKIKMSEAAKKKQENDTYLNSVAYMSMKKNIKEESAKVEKLRDKLLERVMADGVDIDDKYKELSMGNIKVGVVFRQTDSLDYEIAAKILKKKQLFDRATTPTIDPDKVMDLYREKLLTQDDIARMSVLKRTPALVVEWKKKEDGSDAEA